MARSGSRLTAGVLVWLLAWAALATPAFARNPLAGVFGHLLDETKSELAVGLLLIETLGDEMPVSPPASSPALCRLAQAIGQRSPRNSLVYQVTVIEGDEPLEIALPGGHIALGRPLVEAASATGALEFLLARNIWLIAERQPVALIKAKGLYGALLRQAKTPRPRRHAETLRELLFSYLEAVGHFNHGMADRAGLDLCQEPEPVRSAVAILQWLRTQLASRSPRSIPGLEQRLRDLTAGGIR